MNPGKRWLDPEWHSKRGYQSAKTHATSDSFAKRQKARMKAAEKEREEAEKEHQVIPIRGASK